MVVFNLVVELITKVNSTEEWIVFVFAPMSLAENLDFVDVFGGAGAVTEGFSPCLNQPSDSLIRLFTAAQPYSI